MVQAGKLPPHNPGNKPKVEAKFGESEFYLEEANWNYAEALKAFKEDLEVEVLNYQNERENNDEGNQTCTNSCNIF